MKDVLVIGGGVSGTVAAIAAARTGADTLLVEKHGFCGGTLTNAGVGPMMTFFAGDRQVVFGIAQEIIDRLMVLGGSPGHVADTTGYVKKVTPIDVELHKLVLDQMLQEAGVEVLFHTMLADARLAEGQIAGVTLCNKAGLVDHQARVYVDASGDADLCRFAGLTCFKGRKEDGLWQPMTANVKISNVDLEQIRRDVKRDPANFILNNVADLGLSHKLSMAGYMKELEEAKERGEITFEREAVLFFETPNDNEVILNMTRVLKHDGTDPCQLSRAEMLGRAQAREAFNFLKRYIPAFRDAVFLSTGPQIGVRETNHIDGRYTLKAEDLLSGKAFPDAIARGGYPLDIHNPAGNHTTTLHLKEGLSYTIPYRSLLPREADNLLVCGRCIAATHEAAAAIRVTPIAMATGQAAGTAAALSVRQGVLPGALDVDMLQQQLRADRVNLDAP